MRPLDQNQGAKVGGALVGERAQIRGSLHPYSPPGFAHKRSPTYQGDTGRDFGVSSTKGVDGLRTERPRRTSSSPSRASRKRAGALLPPAIANYRRGVRLLRTWEAETERIIEQKSHAGYADPHCRKYQQILFEKCGM